VTGADIGAIRVFDDESWVQISEAKVPALVASLGADGEVEKGVKLRRAKGEPPAQSGDAKRPPPGKKPFRPRPPRDGKGPLTKPPAKPKRPAPAGKKPPYRKKPTGV